MSVDEKPIIRNMRKFRINHIKAKAKTAIIKRREQLYPKPLETRLITVLGGTVLTVGAFRHKKTGYPLSLVLSRGRLLRSERFRRSVRVDDGGTLELANDIKWAITIRGSEYYRDVVAAYERDELLKEQGWRIRYISMRDLGERPGQVRADIRSFFLA